jgi:hypothetical protein
MPYDSLAIGKEPLRSSTRIGEHEQASERERERSVPVDRYASRTSANKSDTPLSLPLQPFQGAFIIFQIRLEFLTATLVVVLERM